MAVVAVLHGLGNHLDIIKEAGTSVVSKFLFFTWLTVFFFNIAIPLGKVAAASFLIELNARTSMAIPLPPWQSVLAEEECRFGAGEKQDRDLRPFRAG